MACLFSEVVVPRQRSTPNRYFLCRFLTLRYQTRIEREEILGSGVWEMVLVLGVNGDERRRGGSASC
jgi:hypothetical protein